jgi:hypothetical protein
MNATTTANSTRSADIEASLIEKGDVFQWHGRDVKVSTAPELVCNDRRVSFRAWDAAENRYRDMELCKFSFVRVRL